mgnify:CR=1 FL=1
MISGLLASEIAAAIKAGMKSWLKASGSDTRVRTGDDGPV